MPVCDPLALARCCTIPTVVYDRQGSLSTGATLIRRYFTVLFVFLAILSGCTHPGPRTSEPPVFVGRPEQGEVATEAPPRKGALWYHIEPGDESIAVRIRLLDPPAQTTFFMPGPWAGNDDFDQLIVLGGARGPSGPLPLVVDRAEGRIDIDVPDSAWVELAYRVKAAAEQNDDQRFHPRSGPDSFFAYAPTILVLPSAGLARQLRQIPVEVHLPPAWSLTSTWPVHLIEERSDRQIAGFIAADIRTLRDAFIGAGEGWNRQELSLPSGAIAITLAGDFALDQESFRTALRLIGQSYLERFGRYQELEGLVLPVGREAHNFLRGMGRYGGFVLEVSQAQTVDDDFLILLAHELFHSWNGHELVPAPAADEQTRWFKEGVTHYIALKTLAKLELLDDRGLRRELATSAQFYEQNPIISGGTIRPVDRLRLPYDQGVLLALAIDLLLLNSSQGEFSVENWIQTLLSPAFHSQSGAYDMRLLQQGFEAMSSKLGLQTIRQFQQLLERRRALDLESLFHGLGLHYLPTTADEPARLLPLEANTPYHQIFSPAPTKRVLK